MKEEIINQAIYLFEKKGFSKTTIDDIVKEMNVTKGTFYYYFRSKENLLNDIHDDYITKLIKRHKFIVDNQELTQRDKIKNTISMLINEITDKGASARVFFREIRHLNNSNSESIKKKRAKFRKNIEDIIRVGIVKGEFQDNLRPDMIAFGILGILNWSYNWYDPEGEITCDELSDIFSDMILIGIMK